VLVFLTIYIFTYILGWYTDTAILTGKINFENENNLQIKTDTKDGFTTTLTQNQMQQDSSIVSKLTDIKGYESLLTYAIYSM
jgi:predicted XRE-type DNA-binding protein